MSRPRQFCSAEECDKPRKGLGYCGMHYARLRRTGDHRMPSWSATDPTVEKLADGSTEEWRPVPGNEGRYEVSDRGRVRSLPRPKVRSVRLLKASPDTCGYPAVHLWTNDGKQSARRVHELVMLAFVGPRPSDCQHIRHLDGNRSNNAASNLRYGTVSENAWDRIRHGTHHEANKTHCSKGHAFTAENTYRLPSRPRSRYCRTCSRDSRNQRRARQRALGLTVT